MPKPYEGPMNFTYHPWSVDIVNYDGPELYAEKSAQMGFSVDMMVIAFHALDQRRLSVLYGLPNQIPDARDFSTARFNPLIKSSPYIANMFTDINSIGLKMCGNNALYIRGSGGKAAFDSIPVGMVILDEIDKMSEHAIRRAVERQSAQIEKFFRGISTPSVPDFGIDKLYKTSTQDDYTFRCPHCSKYITLIFPDSLVITADSHHDPKIKDSHLICTECSHKLSHIAKPEYLKKGKWIPKYPDRIARGVTISQLYSCSKRPHEIAIAYLKSFDSPVEEQELHNSILGLPHIVEGAKIDENTINSCIRIPGYRNGDLSLAKGFITMGIDVGRHFHISIVKWRFPQENLTDPHHQAIGTLIWQGKIPRISPDFTELDKVLHSWPEMQAIVIDAAPERASSLSFAKRYKGLAFTCDYNESAKGKEIQHDANGLRVSVNRTMYLDLALSRINDQKPRIFFPMDLDQEYKIHLQALVRKPEQNTKGETIYRYIKVGARTDYAHTLGYNEVALEIGLSNGAYRIIS